MVSLFSTLVIASAWILSLSLAMVPMFLAKNSGAILQVFAVGVAGLVFVLVFPLLLGVISRGFQKGIVPGKYSRQTAGKLNFYRRVYEMCWTHLFCFKAIYSVVLAIPEFRWLVLRLFGYRGSNDFKAYPDTGIRDLPLLKIEPGVHIADRTTIGTNLVLRDGSVLVGAVTLQENSLIGQLCRLGAGVRLCQQAKVGMRTSLGIRVDLRKHAQVRPNCVINHGTVIGEHAFVGAMSFVGTKCIIGPGVKVPSGATIPDGAFLKTQEDCDRYVSLETSSLNNFREAILNQIRLV